MDQFAREELLLGEEGMARLAAARVAIFGVGGVGGYVAEALGRSGVGRIDLFDDDEVCLSNINRQIIATHSTLGRKKVEVMAERLRDINPEIVVGGKALFYLPSTADEVDLSLYGYVVDAVDTLAAKLELALRCKRLGVPIISAMGAGNKLDPTRIRVGDVFETSGCPLARVMRKELRKRGVEALKVAYSTEEPTPHRGSAAQEPARSGSARRSTPGSTAFVPSVMGLIMAGEIVRELSGVGTGNEKNG